MARLLATLLAATIIAGCGGMNRAVGVLLNTGDDLAKRTEPFRAGRELSPSS